MADYEFTVREVTQGSIIGWEAIENKSGHIIPLHQDGNITAGNYPELSKHLQDSHELAVTLSYDSKLGDNLAGTTWTFWRNGDRIIIRDIPRAVLRISSLTP